MGQVGKMIANTGNAALWYMERLLDGVDDSMFAVKPRGASGEIDTNHPAFVLGHLSLYPSMLARAIGADPGPAVPEGYEALFSHAATCVSDPDGSVYPAREGVTAFFFDTHRHLLGVLAEVDDAVFGAPNEHEATRDLAPTVGDLADFMVGLHVATHLGQVSAWRRCMGLGAAFRLDGG